MCTFIKNYSKRSTNDRIFYILKHFCHNSIRLFLAFRRLWHDHVKSQPKRRRSGRNDCFTGPWERERERFSQQVWIGAQMNTNQVFISQFGTFSLQKRFLRSVRLKNGPEFLPTLAPMLQNFCQTIHGKIKNSGKMLMFNRTYILAIL